MYTYVSTYILHRQRGLVPPGRRCIQSAHLSAHRTQTLESSPGIETEGEGGGQRETEFLLLYGTRFPHQLRQHVVSRLARTVLSLLS